MKEKLKLKLKTKIILLNMFLIFISLVITMIFISSFKVSSIKKENETSIMNVAHIVSKSSIVINSLRNKVNKNNVQDYVENILKNTEKIDIIVVADMNGIRYAHPNKSNVGLKFVGGDEKKVIDKGKTYISKASGTLGNQIRAFVPVIDDEGKQYGFVMVSSLTQSIDKEKNKALITLILLASIGFFIGTVTAVIFSKNIKNALLGYEPEQITKLYLQKKEVLDAMNEGIIAIDKNEKVTLFNKAALNMLNIKGNTIIGNKIYNLVPNSRLPLIMKDGKVEYNKDMIVNKTIIFSSRIPIKQNGKIVGAVAIFRDKTEVTRLAEELTGVKQIVEALRANTHEFMNKLHVILGLIQIGEIKKAKKYILDVTKEQQEKVSLVVKKIKEPTIAALLLGKISRAKENGIDLFLDSKSTLEKSHFAINNNDFITILGNLIENAIESISISDKTEKIIRVLIFQSKDEIKISVEDTGIGIKKEELPCVFERGFSTKGENRGTGLFLIKNIVDICNGTIDIKSKENGNTKFEIIIPKEG